MHKREYTDTDGKCFAFEMGTCIALVTGHAECGTYMCPFYKPKDCKDWVRIETSKEVRLYAPEDYVNEKKNK